MIAPSDGAQGRFGPVNTSEAFDRLSNAPVGYLATAGANGRPHLVPFVFALDDRRIVSAVDHKPKRSQDLRRVRNIAANPAVSVLVDHYEEDRHRLWWVASRRARTHRLGWSGVPRRNRRPRGQVPSLPGGPAGRSGHRGRYRTGHRLDGRPQVNELAESMSHGSWQGWD